MSIYKDLSCNLTDDERLAKGQEAARALERYDELEQEKKDQTRAIADEMKGLRAATKKLARQLRDGKEVRPVECAEDLEFRTGTVRIIRKDTGEVVETRPMTAKERTPSLFEVRKPEKAEPKKKAAAEKGAEP